MANERSPLALYQILDAIADFRDLIGEHSVEEISADKMRRYAAERCVEIISEASRRIPAEWKVAFSEIPWPQIANIGNIIRHSYENVNPDIIVGLRGQHLDDLERAILALLDQHDPEGREFRNS